MTNLADVILQRPSGDEVRLGDVLDHPTIVVMTRYYGCLPCRAYISAAAERYDEIKAAGVSVLGLGPAAAHQAAALEAGGVPFPLLLDPERRVYRALGIGRLNLWQMLRPRSIGRYARAIRSGSRQGSITHPMQRPGLAVLDTAGEARFVHVGTTLGDYPPLDEAIERARE